ncbi:hypothetical protein, variant [Aphanomyces invadans]|uniref:TIR domain-containing protein n=1 Tax=Aphanomyces invadans TaxID=157072 RepID=A0A024TJI0_9STRA|nr:hypothetical protein, variant [Aphanomyces invadans]ETV94300.1 hypothetical protein, variant [Aphanomyces invadans]|eukprot:XP_008877061.1 hypothetical protein, variant [Aphanomyces invadans]
MIRRVGLKNIEESDEGEPTSATSFSPIMSPLPVVVNEQQYRGTSSTQDESTQRRRAREHNPLADSIAPCMESPCTSPAVPRLYSVTHSSSEDILLVTDKGVRIQHGPMSLSGENPGANTHDELSPEEENINHNSTRSSWSYHDHQLRINKDDPSPRPLTPVHSEHLSASNVQRRRNTKARSTPEGSFASLLRNSFFAFRLISSSLVLVVVATACVVLHEIAPSTHHWCANLADATKYSHVVAISTLANAILVIPALLPSYCGLYRVSKARKVIRRPFLQVCEIVVVGQLVVYIIQFLLWAFKMFQVPTCPAEVFAPSDTLTRVVIYLKLWSILPCGLLIWWQVTMFCLFRTHLKLQIGSANDSRHSANLKGWLKRLFTLPSFGRRNKIIRQLRTDLFKAAMTGDLPLAESLLTRAEQLLGREFAVRKLYHEPRLWLWSFATSRKNPLHVAVARGDCAMIELFLKFRFDVNALDKVARVNFNFGLFFKWTRLLVTTQDYLQGVNEWVFLSVLVPPLHVAVQQGQIEAVRTLLKHHANVNTLPRASFYWQAAVKPAIFFADHVQVMKLLLAHQTNHLYVATQGASVMTPLQRNVLTFRTAQSTLLEEHGSDVALTPLHAAAASNNAAKLDAFLRRGVDPDTLGELVTGIYKRTALHWAAISGSAACVLRLLAHKANPEAKDRDGRTPLHWAARNNHLEVVQVLLMQGQANPNTLDYDGSPVLYFAAGAEGVSAKVVSALVEAGANLAYTDAQGNTPLHIALINENRTTAVSLLRNGADITATNMEGRRAVDCTTSTELQFAVKKEAGARDVMISYTHAHSSLAKGVRDYLSEHARMTCWMDTMDPSGIGGGAVWREEIARGIFHAKVVVAVVCDGYSRSEWCLKELAFARLARTPGTSSTCMICKKCSWTVMV